MRYTNNTKPNSKHALVLCAQQIKDRLRKFEPRCTHRVELIAKRQRGKGESHKTLGRVGSASEDKELDHRHHQLVHLHDIGRGNNTLVIEVGRNVGFEARNKHGFDRSFGQRGVSTGGW